MSPYLVHMTGRDAIAKILAGDGAAETLPAGTGFLKALVPQYEDLNQPFFSLPVVCFSESPLFALDFFRYRSYRRWQDDQRFGIGVNKAKLAELGVRPVAYLDDEMRSYMRSLQAHGDRLDWQLTTHDTINKKLRGLIEGLAPLVFPLLEDHKYQGFMWEREWRATSPEGLVFGHDDIEIICCPPDEEARIREALGAAAAKIQFVRTWLEYDDVTSFLQQREELRQPYAPPTMQGASLTEQIVQLDQQRTLHEVAIHSLEGFVALSEQIASRADMAKRELEALKVKKAAIEVELRRARAEQENEQVNKEKERRDALAKRTPRRR